MHHWNEIESENLKNLKFKPVTVLNKPCFWSTLLFHWPNVRSMLLWLGARYPVQPTRARPMGSEAGKKRKITQGKKKNQGVHSPHLLFLPPFLSPSLLRFTPSFPHSPLTLLVHESTIPIPFTLLSHSSFFFILNPSLHRVQRVYLKR